MATQVIGPRASTRQFIASAAIAVQDAVSFDLSKTSDDAVGEYVLKLDTDTATATAFAGVALTAATAAGDVISVCVKGVCDAKVSTSTVAGSRLCAGATGGELAIQADVNESGSAAVVIRPIVAIATEADTAGVARIFIL